jgi:hypothetical protein
MSEIYFVTVTYQPRYALILLEIFGHIFIVNFELLKLRRTQNDQLRIKRLCLSMFIYSQSLLS